MDGNGRAGRLLNTLFLIERETLPTPLLYLSAFFEATRREYYDGLRAVSERGEWEKWLEYSLNGVARQSEDALSRAQRINGRLTDWRRKMAGASSNTPALLLDALAANPFLTITKPAHDLGVAFTTVWKNRRNSHPPGRDERFKALDSLLDLWERMPARKRSKTRGRKPLKRRTSKTRFAIADRLELSQLENPANTAGGRQETGRAHHRAPAPQNRGGTDQSSRHPRKAFDRVELEGAHRAGPERGGPVIAPARTN